MKAPSAGPLGALARAEAALSAIARAELALTELHEALKRGDVILPMDKANERASKEVKRMLELLERWGGRIGPDVERWRDHERRAAP